MSTATPWGWHSDHRLVHLCMVGLIAGRKCPQEESNLRAGFRKPPEGVFRGSERGLADANEQVSRAPLLRARPLRSARARRFAD